jgi:hypothetical protein
LAPPRGSSKIDPVMAQPSILVEREP